jgi:hypothetical protein
VFQYRQRLNILLSLVVLVVVRVLVEVVVQVVIAHQPVLRHQQHHLP